MQAFLKKHAPGHASHTVKVQWSLSGREIQLDFQVNKRDGSSWQIDENLSSDWKKNWGLWNKDVVEAFLQLRQHQGDTSAPYLEIQVSPANQPFALVILEPRKSFHPPEQLDFSSHVEVEGRSWKAQMKVTLPEEIKGDKLYGGFFACLGEGSREFFALEPNPESNPDFHRPELFTPLEQ